MSETPPPAARITVSGTVVEVPAIETWTGNEWVVLERELGITPVKLPEMMRAGSVSLVLGCLWIARHRVDALASIADFGGFALGDGTFRVEWDPKPDPVEAAPEPAPEAVDAVEAGPSSTTPETIPGITGSLSSADSTG